MSYVLTGYKWGEASYGRPGGTVTFAFDPTFYGGLRLGAGTVGAAEVAARLALETWAQVSDVTFVHAADGEAADITFAMASQSGNMLGTALTTFFVLPGVNQVISSVVTLNSQRTWSPLGEAGLNFYNVVLHELGHSLGLDHPPDPSQVMYDFYQTDTTLRLGTGDMAGIDVIYGGGGGRVPLVGSFAGDVIDRSGQSQGEIIFGLAGNDTIFGGSGNDRISGGSGNDTIHGGAGDDDIANLMGDGTILAGPGNDRVFGGIGRNTIDGGPGDDLLVGGTGPDTLIGGSGRDVIIGDPPGAPYFGNDRIDGGPGDDLLMGGGGADVFVFRATGGNDLVARFDVDWADPLASRAVGPDFVPGIDRIEFETGTFSTPEEVFAATSDVGGSAVIRWSATTSITLFGVTEGELTADSFIFGGAIA